MVLVKTHELGKIKNVSTIDLTFAGRGESSFNDLILNSNCIIPTKIIIFCYNNKNPKLVTDIICILKM